MTKSIPARAARERSDPEAPLLTSETLRSVPSAAIAAAAFTSETPSPSSPTRAIWSLAAPRRATG